MTTERRAMVKNYIKRYLIITLGCVLYPIGVVMFLQASGIATGGATGIALIINQVTGVSTGVLAFVINVPLLLWGWKVFGRDFFVSTLYVIALSSLLMWLTEYIFFNLLPEVYGINVLPFADGDRLINGVTGGAIFGLGMGLIFRCGSSSGGTDIPVKVLKKKFRHISTGTITMVTDIIIVACSVFAYDDKLPVLFFTVLSVAVFTLVFDWVLYGGNSAKMVFIISQEEPARRICARILKELDAGATYVDGEGAYTGEKKKVLLCVVKPIIYPKLRDIVRQEDKKAFMIVSSAKEIYGEGYIPPDKEEI